MVCSVPFCYNEEERRDHMETRIQQLRKEKGLSQEALAEALHVSRQAVSKWENGLAEPEVDKIILMSDFFGVTTDYLLKGITRTENTGDPDPRGFAVFTTAMVAVGYLLAAAFWHTWQTMWATAIGAVLMIAGITLFLMLQSGRRDQEMKAAEKTFWSVNHWILLFFLLSEAYNALWGFPGAPYPIPTAPILPFGIFCMLYGVLGILIFRIIRKKR